MSTDNEVVKGVLGEKDALEVVVGNSSFETNVDRVSASFRAKRKCKKCHGKGYLECSSPNVIVGNGKFLTTSRWESYDILCECSAKSLKLTS